MIFDPIDILEQFAISSLHVGTLLWSHVQNQDLTSSIKTGIDLVWILLNFIYFRDLQDSIQATKSDPIGSGEISPGNG